VGETDIIYVRQKIKSIGHGSSYWERGSSSAFPEEATIKVIYMSYFMNWVMMKL
jgi:hypothetical protein